jgi:formylglycine-generating enzyme required for sulfatase activity
MKEAPDTWHPDVVNRFTFTDIPHITKYGIVTDVTTNNGVAVFNGTTSLLEFSCNHTGVYTIRFKINKLNSLTQVIAKLSSTISLSVNDGIITTTGITTPSIYINGKLNSTITANGGDVFIVSTTPFTIDDFVLGYDSTYFSGEIDLIEFFNDALVEGMVDAIYSGRYFRQHPSDLSLVKRMKTQGYIWVPGNTEYDGCENGFWVAKYQMKASKTINGRGLNVSDFPGMTSTYNTWYYDEDPNVFIVSTPEGSPITRITQSESIAACEAIGGHLITNDEWMTIARNIEQVPSNWSSGSVGSGYIYSGHNDGAPEGALEASIDTNGYAGTGQTTGNQRRTLTLTNGEIIWDLAGNVWQWIDNVISYSAPPRYLDNGTPTTGARWYDYSPNGGSGYYIDPNNLGSFPLEKKDLYLLDESYNANNGVGRIYLLDSSTNRGFLRGGRWIFGASAGVLSLFLYNDPSYRSISIGFRCVVVP